MLSVLKIDIIYILSGPSSFEFWINYSQNLSGKDSEYGLVKTTCL